MSTGHRWSTRSRRPRGDVRATSLGSDLHPTDPLAGWHLDPAGPQPIPSGVLRATRPMAGGIPSWVADTTLRERVDGGPWRRMYFPVSAAYLQVRRQSEGEFDDAIVHEGRARFYAHRHACAIDLLELRVYQGRDEFMGEHPLQDPEFAVQWNECNQSSWRFQGS